ncbi:MAG: FKBP-type peptidyl-prolyl cis-trans isomerase [Longimicrobiales bacterium]|nr:FKBP-type peptidyl-prolyl cis-trans isomerase [Longimicrobiales bacterium]
MKSYSKYFLVVLCSMFYGCEGETDLKAPVSLAGDEELASYGFGQEIGNSLLPMKDYVEIDKLFRGIEDALDGIESPVPMAELAQAGQRFVQKVEEEQRTEMEAVGVDNTQEGEAFLETNALVEGVTITDSGLQYLILEEATGPTPESTNQVRVHYRGTLIDGTEFDSSYSRNEPATFGVQGVIPGFGEGLQLMSVGSKYRFFIPSELAYGANGAGGMIGPNATLIFELELLEIL